MRPQATLTPSLPVRLETRPPQPLGIAAAQAREVQPPAPIRPNPIAVRPTLPPRPSPKPPIVRPVQPEPILRPKPKPRPEAPVAITVVPPSRPEPGPHSTAAPQEGPIEIEVVPPEDPAVLQQLQPAPPQDPQAVLKTPLAVHFGYTYSRSLSNLMRDGQLKFLMVGSGYTSLKVRLENKGKRPIHGFFFPGMIFKPKKNTQFAPLILTDRHEFFLYPDSPQELQFQGFSLDRKKPLPDERFPLAYRLEPDRDSRYPTALRVVQALLELESDPVKTPQSPTYTNHRNTILQLALWRATSGRYRADEEVAQLVGGINPQDFPKLRDAIYAEVEALSRYAARL